MMNFIQHPHRIIAVVAICLLVATVVAGGATAQLGDGIGDNVNDLRHGYF